MPRNNTELKHLRSKLNYGPHPYGSKAGTPTVSIKLSMADSNAEKVSTIEATMENYGWKTKIQSGFARFLIHGSDPLADEHLEGIVDFNSVVGPRFVDYELHGEDISQIPSRTVQNMADSFTLFLEEGDDYDEASLEYFSERGTDYGDVDFVFPVDSFTDRDFIQRISREFKLYDSDIWVYPKGLKVNTVAENYEKAEKISKRNTWNVSPRMDIVAGYEDE